METQTVEQFLFEQLEKIAPGKYTLASVLQIFKSKLRFPCTHLKGGRGARGPAWAKDYNLSVFTFSTGVTEIRCLYGCGLKVRSTEADMKLAFAELMSIASAQSTNTPAAAESVYIVRDGKRSIIDPGPVPVYTDADRARIKHSNDLFWNYINKGLQTGIIKPGDPILGGEFPHPDPIPSPDSIVKHNMLHVFAAAKKPISALSRVSPLKAEVSCFIPALEPVVTTNTKIRKARKTRKTQSRKRGK